MFAFNFPATAPSSSVRAFLRLCYAIGADKLVMLGNTSYDGTTFTNRFHPLWFALVALVRRLFEVWH
jgi:hypothetical protein